MEGGSKFTAVRYGIFTCTRARGLLSNSPVVVWSKNKKCQNKEVTNIVSSSLDLTFSAKILSKQGSLNLLLLGALSWCGSNPASWVNVWLERKTGAPFSSSETEEINFQLFTARFACFQSKLFLDCFFPHYRNKHWYECKATVKTGVSRSAFKCVIMVWLNPASWVNVWLERKTAP